MITKFDRQSVRKTTNDIVSELQQYAKDNGLVIERGGCSFDDTFFNLKIKVTIKGSDTQEMRDLKQHIGWLDEHIDLNKVADINGKSFKLVGYKTRATKKPYIIQDVKSNSEYVCSEDLVKRHFVKECA